MKRQVRCGVFETNSSMTHALTICTEEEYEKWQNGELLLHHDWRNGDKFVPNEEVPKDADMKYDYQSYDNYNSEVEDYFEPYEEHFTTPSGDNMVVFGYYGHD